MDNLSPSTLLTEGKKLTLTQPLISTFKLLKALTKNFARIERRIKAKHR